MFDKNELRLMRSLISSLTGVWTSELTALAAKIDTELAVLEKGNAYLDADYKGGVKNS